MNADSVVDNSAASGLSADSAAQVLRILEEYLDARERGRPPHLDELTARYPEHAELLRAYVEKLETLHQAAAGLRPAPAEGPAAAYRIPEGGRLGDFQIQCEVGRGGMGIVYEAQQLSLGRLVALKVLPFAAALDAKQLQRFKNEAQAAALLHHTNIVPVHAVGCDRGVHYYAMQFIEGQTLAALIAQLRQLAGLGGAEEAPAESSESELPATWPQPAHGNTEGASPRGPEDAERSRESLTTPATLRSSRDPAFFRAVVSFGVQAAEALEHAHRLGIVHRDVKPANLLVDTRFHLWVTDFGLALCQSEAGLTLTGDLVGTLRYMSPEQALGKRYLIDHRTDIYSLGVTLYELLTLEPAYDGRDRQELLRQIAFEEPRPPRHINPAVPRELETIVLKAMSKEPETRYATALELADDLRRFLENKPILARRPTLSERAAKWARRHRPVVVAAAVLLAVAMTGSVASSALIWRAHQQTKAALEQVKSKENEAQVHRQRAELNFGKACAGVTQLLLAVEERRYVSDPNITKLRRELAERGLQFFTEFLREGNPDPAVRLESGRAQFIVATVYGLQNDRDKAKMAYAKAIALFEQLHQEFPENATYLYEMARGHNILGLVLDGDGLRDKARPEFLTAIRLYREAIKRQADSRAYNNLAWMLATCPQEEFRSAVEAVTLARTAVSMSPCCGHSWNTLGVALYRAENWQAAVAALEQSMHFREGGDSGDWFFLAMAYKQLGDEGKAREWYERAKQDVQKADMSFEPLSRYRQEAEALLEGRSPPKNDRTESAPKRAAWLDIDLLRLACPSLPGACPVADGA